jgi:hypothetical protein
VSFLDLLDTARKAVRGRGVETPVSRKEEDEISPECLFKGGEGRGWGWRQLADKKISRIRCGGTEPAQPNGVCDFPILPRFGGGKEGAVPSAETGMDGGYGRI